MLSPASALRRLGQAVLLTVVSLGAAASPAVRYSDLGHQLVCPCSCAQILIECNHVGCPDSDGMLRTLKASIASGQGDEAILRLFQAKYGPTALAAPMLTRFNAVAWIVPPAMLGLGLLLAVSLTRRWRETRTQQALLAQAAPSPAHAQTLDRVRRETEL